jgi:hypothetical protein
MSAHFNGSFRRRDSLLRVERGRVHTDHFLHRNLTPIFVWEPLPSCVGGRLLVEDEWWVGFARPTDALGRLDRAVWRARPLG